MRTFRLDRIDHVPDILPDPAVPKPDDYSVSEYCKRVFRMYDTDQPTEVELLCNASIMKVLIDNFGIDVDTEPSAKRIGGVSETASQSARRLYHQQ